MTGKLEFSIADDDDRDDVGDEAAVAAADSDYCPHVSLNHHLDTILEHSTSETDSDAELHDRPAYTDRCPHCTDMHTWQPDDCSFRIVSCDHCLEEHSQRDMLNHVCPEFRHAHAEYVAQSREYQSRNSKTESLESQSENSTEQLQSFTAHNLISCISREGPKLNTCPIKDEQQGRDHEAFAKRWHRGLSQRDTARAEIQTATSHGDAEAQSWDQRQPPGESRSDDRNVHDFRFGEIFERSWNKATQDENVHK